jgi:hypothetical protein
MTRSLLIFGAASHEDVDVWVLGVPMVDGDPIEASAEVTRGLVHELAGEGPQARELTGIIGRDDEPEVMPVVPATSGEGAAVRLVSGRIEQLALRPIASHPVTLESGGDEHSISPRGAMGLMQLMPGTWVELSIRHGLGRDPFTTTN